MGDIPLKSGNIEATKYFKFQAFTTAVVEDHKVHTRIKAALAGAIKRGESKQQFFKNLQHTFDDFKLGSAKQLETVFTTNTALAYGAGQQKAIIEHQDTFPYWQYVAVMDGRTRDEHARLNGKIFRASDHAFYPPIGFNCRCTAIPLIQEEYDHLVGQTPSAILTPHADNLPNSEFIGNKQQNFIRWLQSQYDTLDPQSKPLIDKAVKEFTSSTKTIITKHRKQIHTFAKEVVAGKTFSTKDEKKITLSNKDIKDILNQPHDDIFAKNNLLKQLPKVFKNAVLIKSAPENKGRSKYLKWYYYKYKENFYLNVVELPNGSFKLHSISSMIK